MPSPPARRAFPPPPLPALCRRYVSPSPHRRPPSPPPPLLPDPHLRGRLGLPPAVPGGRARACRRRRLPPLAGHPRAWGSLPPWTPAAAAAPPSLSPRLLRGGPGIARCGPRAGRRPGGPRRGGGRRHPRPPSGPGYSRRPLLLPGVASPDAALRVRLGAAPVPSADAPFGRPRRVVGPPGPAARLPTSSGSSCGVFVLIAARDAATLTCVRGLGSPTLVFPSALPRSSTCSGYPRVLPGPIPSAGLWSSFPGPRARPRPRWGPPVSAPRAAPPACRGPGAAARPARRPPPLSLPSTRHPRACHLRAVVAGQPVGGARHRAGGCGGRPPWGLLPVSWGGCPPPDAGEHRSLRQGCPCRRGPRVPRLPARRHWPRVVRGGRG